MLNPHTRPEHKTLFRAAVLIFRGHSQSPCAKRIEKVGKTPLDGCDAMCTQRLVAILYDWVPTPVKCPSSERFAHPPPRLIRRTLGVLVPAL